MISFFVRFNSRKEVKSVETVELELIMKGDLVELFKKNVINSLTAKIQSHQGPIRFINL